MSNKEIIESQPIIRPGPKKFVGLHAHDGFSTFDGLGPPKDHFEFVIENTKNETDISALAITNHGHCNSYAHAHVAATELNSNGRRFKFLPGSELYVHPDLEEWKKLKTKRDDGEDDQSEHGSTIENEDETKSSKFLDPIKRRHHLVVLAKHDKGLENLFATVSRGYIEGFYKFPRVDYKMLKMYKGSFIASSACIGGPLAYEIFSKFPHHAFDEKGAQDLLALGKSGPMDFLGPHLLDDEAVFKSTISCLENHVDKLVDAVGEENFFLELQFNKLSAQHLVNRALIELSKKTGIPLIVTVDSHYCKPDVWKEREIYKKLGWLNYRDHSPVDLPKSVDELKCELYPKNAQQVWDSYLDTTKGLNYYDDDLIRDAMERTHDIAFNLIDDVKPDAKIKLPSWSVREGMTPAEDLREQCMLGLKAIGKADDPVYLERFKTELAIFVEKNFCEYFLTMKKIIDIANREMLTGCGRGSGPGSLINYLLGITQLDPIKHGLLFERFVNRYRKELPDIDTDVADRDMLIKLLKKEFGDLNVLPVSNYNTFQLKSLIKDVSRFFHVEGAEDGLSFQEVNAVLTPLDSEVRNKVLKQGDDKNLFELKLDDCVKYSARFKQFWEAQSEEFKKCIKVLLHENKSLGKHAGGVIVSERVPERMPVILSKKEPQTPFVEGMHNKHLESVTGWCKNDLLGLETLRIINRCIELIIETHGGKKKILTLDEDVTVTVYENQLILLTSSRFKRIADLNEDDDILLPVNLTWPKFHQALFDETIKQQAIS